MKVLLTGGTGFVGARIADKLKDSILCPTLRNMSENEVYALMKEIKPDVVIHTAAISDIGTCERNPDASYHSNIEIPEYLAKFNENAKLIMFSSDQVYTGCKTKFPFKEDFELTPTNVYARHKLEMEQRVAKISPNAVFLRATWMFDMPIYGIPNRGNFVMNVIKSVSTGKPAYYSSTAYRGITYVREISEQIEKFYNVPGGAYNLGAENEYTMYETAIKALQILGADEKLALKGEGGEHLLMDCSKLREHGIVFSSTVEGFRHCLKDYNII